MAKSISLGCTRRDLLAAFLGLPAAFLGCSSGKKPALPEGRIVGPQVDLGHRLRDAPPPNIAADRLEQVSVLIVGGGIAGLTAAWRLAQRGLHDFLLLELEPKPGGTSQKGTSALTAYPWGAHYIPVPMKENRPFVDLLDEMGILEGRDRDGEPIVAEQYLCRDPQERVFFRGRWYEGLYLHAGASADDEAQLQRFKNMVGHWVGWRDGRGARAFTLPVADCSRDAEVTALDRLSMADWLQQQRFTSPRLRWLVEYGCRDDYGLKLSETSAWAGLFYAASRVRTPGAEPQEFMTWPEGNGRVVDYFHGKIGDRVRLGWAAADINPVVVDGEQFVDVVAVNAHDEARGWRARQVIFAGPQFVAARAIRPYRQSPPEPLAAFEYGAWLVANLFLKGRPYSRGFPLAWDNVLYESPSLGYVVATHQRGLDYGPTVLTYYYPFCDANPRQARARLLGLDWESCADLVLTDLTRAHPDIRSLTERLDVMRWGHAMIRPRPGFVWGSARAAARQAYLGIHFAHSDLSGLALFEEAFYHGRRAADDVCRALAPER